MKFRLKDFRQVHKLFQSDMAELLETNQSSISRMELRQSCELTFPQLKTLYDRFGQEEVDSFMTDEKGISVEVVGNTNEGEGTQNNGYFGADEATLSIIRKQSEAITKLVTKQAEQTDVLIALIEKLSSKL